MIPSGSSEHGSTRSVARQDPRTAVEIEDNENSHLRSYGHERARSEPNKFRVGFANIGTYPLQHANREYNLRDFIKHHQFDVFGLAELNVHWKNVSAHQRLHERTRGWFESLHLNTAYWQGFHTNGVSQYGGTSLWSINQGAHRVESSGKDFRGLGRWVWTRYRGKAGVNIRIIIGYRPVPNKTGAASVWSQHKTYFDEHDIPGCPIELFQQDLLAELRKWQEDGDQLALLLDVNKDVWTSQFSRALQAIQLTEANPSSCHLHNLAKRSC